jgi:WD40 repeat protein
MPTSNVAVAIDKFVTFGDLLRYLRRRAGLTQRELAIGVGYSDGQISRLEQNLRLPDLATIPARFAPVLELEKEPALLARLMDLAAAMDREDAPASGSPPFKGLHYFDEGDADLFFGRETVVAGLLARLGASPSSVRPTHFLAVVGASGSGKSSIVRAGLVPALRWNQSSSGWLIHVLTPTARPLEALAASLTREAESVSATATLMDDLAHDPRSLHLFFRRMLGAGPSLPGDAKQPDPSPSISSGTTQVLLVVDQFEELFTLCRDETERRAYVGNLMAAAKPGGMTSVVVTLRADFYAHCAPYDSLREAMAKEQEYIGPMIADDLRRAIEEPLRRGGWAMDPGLVDVLLEDVQGEPGGLPLLSHSLLETWHRRRGRTLTLSGYLASGGVRGAIAETAEAVFQDRLTLQQRAIARRIFLRLTELGESEAVADTRRRATFDELITKPEDAPAVRDTLTMLADARLITMDKDTAEVAHEALIREWPTLRGWLEDDRENLRFHRHLTEAAREWSVSHHGQDLLHRGARLIQAREWAAAHSDEMNDLEREFIDASQASAEREVAEREAQRDRELEAAQKLAATEKSHAQEQASSAKRLRQGGIVLAGALVLAIVAAIFAQASAATAVRERQKAQQQSLISSVRELSSAANANLEIDPERSVLLALQAVNKTYVVDQTVLPEAEDSLHRAVQSSRVELTLRGHADVVWSAVFSPDGTRIATASADGTARVWDATTGKELLTVKGSAYGSVWYAAFSPDGRLLATAGEDKIARIWDATSGEELLALLGHLDEVYHIEFSPDGTRLATISPDSTSRVWDVLTGKELLTLFQGDSAVPYWVTFSPDGSRIAIANTAGFSEGWTSIWDAVTGQMLLTLPRQNSHVDSVSFSPDGAHIVTTSNDQTVRIWDAYNGKEVLTLYGYTINVTNAAYSPDGTRIATVILDSHIRIWDAATGQALLTLAGHSGDILTVAFSPDGARIVTASRDKTARVWSVSPGREFLTLVNGPVMSSFVGARLAYSPDGTRLAVAYSDPTAKVWDMTTGKLLFSLAGHTEGVSFIAYSFDGTRIATAALDGTGKVWNAASGKELLTLSGHDDVVIGVAFSPEGSRLATAGLDKTARIWDAGTGKVIFTLAGGHTEGLSSIAYSPDGSRIATSSLDGTAIVWDAVTGKELFPLTGHTDEVRQVVFSPDGTRLATASVDGSAKLWDAVSGKELLTLSGHAGSVFGVAFSPDGKSIASASGDKTARLWDAATGKELLTLHAPDGLTGVAFSPDGSQLATAGRDGTNRIYLLGIEDLVALAKQRVTRSLTTEECQQYLHGVICPSEP